ncbi:MAG TPA: DUF2203 domain-containing protein [Longimicrobiales bacterium]|nr:DUF2203 domain-containing protein [Longimicrobiales bacterium]
MAEPRYFTLEQANRTLPLVRRIVEDIVRMYPDVQRKLAKLREMADQDSNPALERDMEALRDVLEHDSDELNRYLRELDQIGCQFKGFEEGLVDFHAWMDGRPVLLCWKLGEDRIEWWHELDAGYAGRQPLTPEYVARL